MATLTTPSVGAPETDHSPTAVSEPSMEDILASIRRIIAEDQTNSLGRSGLGSLGRASRTAEIASPAAPASDEITGADDSPAADLAHDHTDTSEGEMHVAPEAVETHRPDEPALVDADVSAAVDPGPHHLPLHDPFVAAELAAPQPDHPVEEQPLMSSAAGASITSSFHALAESVLLQDTAMIERLTREELRPLLKTWLDDNLPSIVERLVRIEIERVARGGRSRD